MTMDIPVPKAVVKSRALEKAALKGMRPPAGEEEEKPRQAYAKEKKPLFNEDRLYKQLNSKWKRQICRNRKKKMAQRNPNKKLMQCHHKKKPPIAEEVSRLNETTFSN
jgi:hypothetical protein